MRGTLLVVVAAGLVAAAESSAVAGCSDGACGRVDWTEITSFEGAKPIAARIHGRYAWESSNQWGDAHPLGGKLNAYLWLSCSAGDGNCQAALAAELAKAGTDAPLYFGGAFYDLEKQKPIQPPILYAEGVTGAAVPLGTANLGFQPFNSLVCPTAFSLAPAQVADAGPSDAAPHLPDGGPTSVDGLPDDSACAIAPGGRGAGWLVLLGFLVVARRRR